VTNTRETAPERVSFLHAAFWCDERRIPVLSWRDNAEHAAERSATRALRSSAMSSTERSFASQITSSGMAMSARQAVGALLSIGGTLIVTRIIGPGTYGMFASALAIQSYVGSLANSGLEVSLLRSSSSDHEGQDRQGLSLVLVMSVIGAALCLGGLPLLSKWIDAPGIRGAGMLIFSSLPLTVIWIVPRARLSRRMAFGRIAVVELLSQAVGVGVALSLAWSGAGIWAPTLGWFCQSLLLTVCFFYSAGPRPSSTWDAFVARDLLRNAWSFSASSLIWQSKSLINPLVVGHYLGPENVGYVALCARLIEVLSFVRNATWHMMIVTFSRIRGDTERLSTYISKATELQVLALAPCLVGFAVIGPFAFPALMGPDWQPVIPLFPYLAGGAIATSLAAPWTAALYALGADARVLGVRLVQVATVGMMSWILVPRFGLIGYGYGELTVIVTIVLIAAMIRAFVITRRVHVVGSWALAAIIAVFWRQVGATAFVAPLLALLVPGSISAIREHLGSLRPSLFTGHK